MIGENTARLASGSFMRERWADLIKPKKHDNRTGEEIAAEVIKKAGLVVRKSESS